jgi:AraC-like DNA-binding protein
VVYKKRIFLFYIAIVLISVFLSSSLLFVTIGNREIAIKKEQVRGEVRKMRGMVDFLFAKLRTDLMYLSSKEELRDMENWYEASDYRAKRRFFADLVGLSMLSDSYDEAVVFHARDDVMIDLKNTLVARIRGSRLERKIRTVAAVMGAHSGEREVLVKLTIDGAAATYLLERMDYGPGGNAAVIMVQLSDGFFQAVLGDIFLVDDSYILILNRDEELVEARVKDERASRADYLSLIPKGGVADAAPGAAAFAYAGGGRFLVSSDESPENKWKYYYGIDFYALRAGIFLILLRCSVMIILVMALCLLIARLVSRKLYEPVEELLQLLDSTGSAEMQDEFAMIQANVSLLMQRNEDLKDSLTQSEPYAREAFLRGLISRTALIGQELEKAMDSLGLSLLRGEGAQYRVYCCLAREGAEAGALANLAAGGKREQFRTDDGLLVLIESFVQGEASAPPAPVLRARAEGAPRIAIGASRAHAGLGSLPEAFQEARIALEHRTMFAAESVIGYDEVAAMGQSIYFYPSAVEERLVSYVKQLDSAGAMEQYAQFTGTARKSSLSFGQLKRMYSHLLDTLVSLLRDFDVSLAPERYDAIRRVWDSLEAASKVDEIDEGLSLIIGMLIDELRSCKESPSVLIANEAREFVDENYRDRNLSLDLIAGELKYSVSHVSAVFRETFGETIKNYITGLRLSRAKELLASTESAISKVSALVGYDNVGSFNKIFKAYIGETPKEYRLRIREK